jgi:hypothetical protein
LSSDKRKQITVRTLYLGIEKYCNDFIRAVIEQTESLAEESENKTGCPICDDFLDGNFNYDLEDGIEHLQQIADAYKLPIKIVKEIPHTKETFIFR